ncbi:hypothetical protein BJV77DRAFT_1022585 [Russula vinacea]|nr:hypothetical protein BJV77DRAFT_1022585 [Russula vinacea]
MVAEQEVNNPFVGCVCGHPGEETPDHVYGREVSRHSGHKSRPRRGGTCKNGLGFARAFANVLDRGVAIEDGLQVDVGRRRSAHTGMYRSAPFDSILDNSTKRDKPPVLRYNTTFHPLRSALCRIHSTMCGECFAVLRTEQLSEPLSVQPKIKHEFNAVLVFTVIS